MKIAIAGASGYTGVELIRILSEYPEVEINQISSRQYVGKKLSSVYPHLSTNKYSELRFDEEINFEESDYFFLCLPHEPSVELVKKLNDKKKKIIDLSAAYRIKNIDAYPEYYGFEHKYPELVRNSVYGLPEIFRKDIEKAQIVANPGCYPTASLLGIYPAAKEKIIEGDRIIINALSGISGAGRSLNQRFHYPEAFGNSYAYNPLKHRHIPEIENILSIIYGKKLKVRFTPHIIPVSRGMIATIVFDTDLTRNQLIELYKLEYRYEPFIDFTSSPPDIKSVVGTNFCKIFVDKDERTNHAIVITVIDNLGKGASSQAVQNFNIMAGFSEEKHLKRISNQSIIFP